MATPLLSYFTADGLAELLHLDILAQVAAGLTTFELHHEVLRDGSGATQSYIDEVVSKLRQQHPTANIEFRPDDGTGSMPHIHYQS